MYFLYLYLIGLRVEDASFLTGLGKALGELIIPLKIMPTCYNFPKLSFNYYFYFYNANFPQIVFEFHMLKGCSVCHILLYPGR